MSQSDNSNNDKRSSAPAADPGATPPVPPLPLFKLGNVVATPGSLETMYEYKVDSMELLKRHVTGDWGQVHPEDAQQNRLALRLGMRILSSYELAPAVRGRRAVRIWIITEADRSVTTFLLPEEY